VGEGCNGVSGEETVSAGRKRREREGNVVSGRERHRTERGNRWRTKG
jgi:hypothetical protein